MEENATSSMDAVLRSERPTARLEHCYTVLMRPSPSLCKLSHGAYTGFGLVTLMDEHSSKEVQGR